MALYKYVFNLTFNMATSNDEVSHSTCYKLGRKFAEKSKTGTD